MLSKAIDCILERSFLVDDAFKKPRNRIEETIKAIALLAIAGCVGAFTAYLVTTISPLTGAIVLMSFDLVFRITEVVCRLLGSNYEMLETAIGILTGTLAVSLVALKILPFLGIMTTVPTMLFFTACHLGVAFLIVKLTEGGFLVKKKPSDMVNENSTATPAVNLQEQLVTALQIPNVFGDQVCAAGLNELVRINHPEAPDILAFLISAHSRNDSTDLSMMMGDVRGGYSRHGGFSDNWRAQWGVYDH